MLVPPLVSRLLIFVFTLCNTLGFVTSHQSTSRYAPLPNMITFTMRLAVPSPAVSFANSSTNWIAASFALARRDVNLCPLCSWYQLFPHTEQLSIELDTSNTKTTAASGFLEESSLIFWLVRTWSVTLNSFSFSVFSTSFFISTTIPSFPSSPVSFFFPSLS